MLANKFDIILPPQDIDCEPGLQQKLADGDVKAFEWVYKNYCKRIYKYSLLLTNNETTSEDIVQDIFIKLWKYKENIRHITNFNSYLYALARNHTLDILKGNKNRLELHNSYNANLPMTADGADELIYFNQTRQLIKEAIDELPSTQRVIYELREQGLKRPVIAARLNKTENSIKGHINRVMNYFKERLGNI